MNLPPHQRYVFKPFSGSSHSWALAHLEALTSTSAILDIGAGSGAIGQVLASKGFTNLQAVEIDPSARQAITAHYQKVEANLDMFKAQKFDAILLLDVLEHLASPIELLQQVPPLLKPKGILLISVPNIAHWSLRLSLAFGRFEYSDRGILDRTHLRFFTRRHLLELAAQVPLEIIERNSSIVPLELLLPRFACNTAAFKLFSNFRLFSARLFPGLFAYQHLLKLQAT